MGPILSGKQTAGINHILRGCILYIANVALDRYIYMASIISMPDIYVRQIRVLAKTKANKPKVDNGKINNTDVYGVGVGDIAAS